MTVSSSYAVFITIRLVEAEWQTVCCFVASDFVLQLITTYKIIKKQRKIVDKRMNDGKSHYHSDIMKLILVELIEGFVPIIYGISMAMAYFGPNYHILSNVGTTYWGKPINDINSLFGMMLLLFVLDSISVVINCMWLWKQCNINMVLKWHRTLSKYWYFIILKLGFDMLSYLASTDVNFGIDGSGKFKWILNDGRNNLINNSMVLSNEEKSLLLKDNYVS